MKTRKRLMGIVAGLLMVVLLMGSLAFAQPQEKGMNAPRMGKGQNQYGNSVAKEANPDVIQQRELRRNEQAGQRNETGVCPVTGEACDGDCEFRDGSGKRSMSGENQGRGNNQNAAEKGLRSGDRQQRFDRQRLKDGSCPNEGTCPRPETCPRNSVQ